MKVSTKTKKQLNDFLVESFSELTDVVKDAKAFAKKELPEVAKEILLFNGIVNNCTSLLTAILIGVLNYRVEEFIIMHWAQVESGWYWTLGLAVPIGLACFIGGIEALQDGVKARIAPRLYLLEYAKNLLNRGNEE